ncbi:MAG: hypothetical protein HOF74_07415 [Gammaproteobacteria bacterium]|jgi:ABC-2 type transport system permease protein|nr:hypothetical protein [Gammaproteobacteria bacterium]MBT3859641.1 hypothetical protein [Gammaproteobacteria bacterium]MBT3986465.1 hypothetical protein [Gammaproteobacteria bacterium]MBT4257429.1 hypothetical protein [Gammaproteobacteria bacterium]MBT4582152.1 hypothetical protein [Gammaproteobacteria bacterium]
MDKFVLLQFYALVKREVLENRNLFVAAPAVLALLMLVAAIWVVSFLPDDRLVSFVEYLGVLFDGLSPTEMAPFFMVVAIPFLIVFYVCCLAYSLNALYQDRRDMSIYFWQSMPVSNLKTVLSKVFTLALVAPLFYIASIFVFYLFAMIGLIIFGVTNDVDVAGLGWMFLASVASLFLVYFSALSATLWLFPTLGWLLLFSAFARKTPLLWAVGAFILVGFLEGFVFGTQYLGNFIQSRTGNFNQYLIMSFGDVFDRLFNYDMLFGVFMGSILIAGAVLMRRFTD